MFNLLPTLEGFSHQTAVGINSVLTAHKKNSDVTFKTEKKCGVENRAGSKMIPVAVVCATFLLNSLS